ncbi:UNVERIFIED_ORG: ParB family chromosome partitioning protein [Nocardia globerula]|uniref:ParB family chromosome partitioning protein n=1 Tax=Nocardia globerula TaxID=1818 RepID=A0A652YIP9_NOCGL|nr:ParB N-terminal domain-containing protein [Nocardia globerula]
MTAILNGPRAIELDGEIFVRLDPSDLDIGDNVRDQVDLTATPEFVESIREHGVLEAISAVQYADGRIVVRDGQRRTLAAREAGVDSIPVIVRLDTAPDERQRNVTRVIAQMEANDNRLALTPGQRAAGVTELLDLGVPVSKVVKAIHVDKEWVENAAKVGRSAVARQSLDEGQLDFEKAAIIAEFEDDEDAVRVLLDRSWGYGFFAYAEQLRAQRIEQEEFEEAAKLYRDKGYTVLDQHPGYGSKVLAVADLQTADGGAVTLEHIEANAAAWTVVLSKEQLITDNTTGLPIDEDTVDWDTEDESEGESIEPEEGFVHVNTVTIEDIWKAEYVCADPEAAGLHLSPIMAAVRAGEASAGGFAVEESAEAEAKRRQLEMQEQQRIERRKVRILNLKAEAATAVRRKFLTELVAAKTPPKAAAVYVATILAGHPGILGEYKVHGVLKEILPLNSKSSYVTVAVTDMIAKASPARAQVITLAMVLAAQESRIEKDGWRSVPVGCVEYLTFLAEQGHELTPVEEVMAGIRTDKQVDLD